MPLVSRLGAASSRGFGEFNQQAGPVYIEDVFSTYLYNGNNTTNIIVNDINISEKGGMLWIKGRYPETYAANVFFDTARGRASQLASSNTPTTNATDAAYTSPAGKDLVSFNSNGFTLSDDYYFNKNTTGAIYTSWTFRKQPKFFDVVTYTGNGVAGRTVSHNLGSVPGMVIIKRTDVAANWVVAARRDSGTLSLLYLNTTGSTIGNVGYYPSSSAYVSPTTFGPGNFQYGGVTVAETNASGGTYVAYLFAHDAGGFGLDGSQNVISCGSFTFNNNGTAGTSVSLGWEPQFILIKPSNTSGQWYMVDNMRGMPVTPSSGSAGVNLYANLSDGEVTSGSTIFPTATGFTCAAGSLDQTFNYIYMAIRRGPMRVPTDATKVFMPTVYTGTNVNNRLVGTTIAPDMVWARQRNSAAVPGLVVGDRLRGQPYMRTGSSAAETTSATAFDQQIVNGSEYGTAFSSMSGIWVGTDATALLNVSTTASNQIAEAFKRAPGFFDAVCYSGTGSNTTVSHNLGVAPEFVIIKIRSGTGNWYVATGFTSTNMNYGNLDNATGYASGTYADFGMLTSIPTSSGVPVTSTFSQAGSTYVMYLFASCPNVSKIGSYTGTGTTQSINCGFTSGARFILIRRMDGTNGSWYVYDTARGIVAANDPYILTNSTAAEVTNTDYVDTYSAGFELSSTAPAGLNGTADGINWTSQTSGFGTSVLASVTYGNGLFVAVSQSTGGLLSTSPDGVTWTSRTSGFGTSGIYAVTYGNSLYVAVGASGKMTTSSDGITWTSQTSGFGTSPIYGVAYGNSLYVAVGDAGTLTTSTDAVTWTSRTSGTANSLLDAVYGNSLYVVVGIGGYLATSTNGTTWTSRTSQFGSDGIYGVTYGNGLYVAVGDNGKISTSTDGTTWTARTSGFGTSTIFYVIYANGTFIAVGDAGKLATSTDGITWTARTSGFGTSPIYGATYGNGKAIIVGDAGKLSTNWANYIYLAIA